MHLAKALKDGPVPGGKHPSPSEMIIHAGDFVGVFSQNGYWIVSVSRGLPLYAMTGNGTNSDVSLLSGSSIGTAADTAG
ncbi:hypothetical protein D9619_011268 [Psilocybe cf. subviscida]|uniref:Uncharacterized protein n=1 Tax=Psilocybe cf. subviscida TaxID=2480587 RepID=A0A8H5BLM1_9AGAR|nr:hypothetical protein D9619_011268 [Psilocybe cf. subviscida]